MKISAAILLLTVTFYFAMTAGGFLPWFLLYVLMAIFAYTTLTRLFVLRGIRVSRRFSATRLYAGDTLKVNIHITRSSVWPLFFLRLQDSLPESWRFQLTESYFSHLTPWAKSIEHTYKISGVERGIYSVRNAMIATGDLFGFSETRRDFRLHDQVVVYPRIVAVSPSFGQRNSGVEGNRATSRVSTDSMSVIGVRKYIPGDRINQIHWSMTAKTGTLQTKDFELHVKSEFLVLPDLSYPSYRYSSKDRFELAMTITASLMKHLCDTRKPFGAAFRGTSVVTLASSHEQTTLLQGLELMAAATPSNQIGFATSLAEAGQEVRPGTTLVVISPCVSKEMAITALSLKRRISIEWFVPLTERLTVAESEGIQLLKSSGVHIHVIEGADKLALSH